MAMTELNVLFKKIQKDDKKEVLEFHVQGDQLPSSQEIVEMAGNVTLLEVKSSEADQLTAEFKSIQRDSKKTVLKFNVMGDSEDQVIQLYPFAGHNVTLFLEPSQMSLEDFNEDEREGMEYNVNKDGTVELEGQVNMDDIPAGEPDDVNFDDDDLLN